MWLLFVVLAVLRGAAACQALTDPQELASAALFNVSCGEAQATCALLEGQCRLTALRRSVLCLDRVAPGGSILARVSRRR